MIVLFLTSLIGFSFQTKETHAKSTLASSDKVRREEAENRVKGFYERKIDLEIILKKRLKGAKALKESRVKSYKERVIARDKYKTQRNKPDNRMKLESLYLQSLNEERQKKLEFRKSFLASRERLKESKLNYKKIPENEELSVDSDWFKKNQEKKAKYKLVLPKKEKPGF